ncbi:MFS transporter [Achromobacter aegrifaciens]|uniref:MFS transporter n=1 Tax=Achromobacter aegrifaciens TaxID=1287736 RepID=UPI0027B92E55|nr:MFS transporter [Achromobacter aegrifaciens]WLW63576.1 MFS transporter [Achromobacter aegrifaciens]
MTAKASSPALTRLQMLAVAGAAGATYLGASMGGAVTLVLPRIASELDASAAQIQWIVAGFLLARIAGLRLAGWLCDTFGAKRVFLCGLLSFSAVSAMCGFASDGNLLVILRVLQGAFAALLSPSALVLLRQAVPEEKEAAAMSVWSAAGMAGFGLSPVLGGLLVHIWGWRAVFLFTAVATLVIGIIAALHAGKAVASRVRESGAPSLPAELLSSTLLAGLAYLVGHSDGLAVSCMALLMAAVLIANAWRAGQTPRLIVQSWLALTLPVSAGVASFALIAGAMLWASYFIQNDLHQETLAFGLGCLPMAALGMGACMGTEPLLAARKVNTAILLSGVFALILTVSAYWAEMASSLTPAIVALACLGLCYGFSNASVTSKVMLAFPRSQAGDASSIATLSKQFGQLLGITVVSSFRDLSGHESGDDHRVFYFFGLSALALIGCAGIGAIYDGRRRQEFSLPLGRWH